MRKNITAVFIFTFVTILLSLIGPSSTLAQGTYWCLPTTPNGPCSIPSNPPSNCASGCYAGACDGTGTNNCNGNMGQNACTCGSLQWGYLKGIATPNPLIAQGTPGGIISLLLTYFFPFIGLLLTTYIIYGGFSFIVASGDPGKIASAYQIITNGLVGFGIIFSAFWMTEIAGIVLGLPDITGIF